VFQRITRCDPLIFIVHQHLPEQIQTFIRDSVLIAWGDEAFEGRLLRRFYNFGDLLGQCQLVTSQVLLEVIRAHDVYDAGHLVVIVRPFEEGVNVEKEASHGAPQ